MGQIVLWGILTTMGSRRKYYKNCRMAINILLQKFGTEEGIGFVDMWASFVERQDLFMNDGLYLSGKGAAVLGTEFVRCINEQAQFKLCAQGGYREPLQENCTNKFTRKTSQNINKKELRCICA